jgi:hypothetical protein
MKMSSMKLLALVPVLSLIAAQARAGTVTLDFSGTVDLASVGGAASNTFSGSITWDPTAAPTATGPLYPGTYYQYTPVTDSLTLNSEDLTPDIYSPYFQLDIIPGVDDFFIIFPLFPVPTGGLYTDFNAVLLDLIGPPGMLSATGVLPGNLDFLGSVSLTESRWITQFEEGPDVTTYGSLAATASVPEPSTYGFTLIGFGLLVLMRKRLVSAMRQPL